MRYQQHETPIDWLKDQGLEMGCFLTWYSDNENTAAFTTITASGDVRRVGATPFPWSSLSGQLHWVPFQDIQKLTQPDAFKQLRAMYHGD